jgi:hypothetical protein
MIDEGRTRRAMAAESDADAEVMQLADEIDSLLAEHSLDIVGVVLVELVARWLAEIPPPALRRRDILAQFVKSTRRLLSDYTEADA